MVVGQSEYGPGVPKMQEIPMHVAVYPDLDTISQQAAQYIVRVANEAIVTRGRFTIALSGGNTPKSFTACLEVNPIAARLTGSWSIYSGATNAVCRPTTRTATTAWPTKYC